MVTGFIQRTSKRVDNTNLKIRKKMIYDEEAEIDDLMINLLELFCRDF